MDDLQSKIDQLMTQADYLEKRIQTAEEVVPKAKDFGLQLFKDFLAAGKQAAELFESLSSRNLLTTGVSVSIPIGKTWSYEILFKQERNFDQKEKQWNVTPYSKQLIYQRGSHRIPLDEFSNSQEDINEFVNDSDLNKDNYVQFFNDLTARITSGFIKKAEEMIEKKKDEVENYMAPYTNLYHRFADGDGDIVFGKKDEGHSKEIPGSAEDYRDLFANEVYTKD